MDDVASKHRLLQPKPAPVSIAVRNHEPLKVVRDQHPIILIRRFAFWNEHPIDAPGKARAIVTSHFPSGRNRLIEHLRDVVFDLAATRITHAPARLSGSENSLKKAHLYRIQGKTAQNVSSPVGASRPA